MLSTKCLQIIYDHISIKKIWPKVANNGWYAIKPNQTETEKKNAIKIKYYYTQDKELGNEKKINEYIIITVPFKDMRNLLLFWERSSPNFCLAQSIDWSISKFSFKIKFCWSLIILYSFILYQQTWRWSFRDMYLLSDFKVI